MRVTGLDLISNDLNVISVGLRQAGEADKFLAKGIFGLDAAELTPKFYAFGANDGSKFYEHSLKPREIVMRLVLNPNYTLNERPASIRDDLYRFVSASRSGELSVVLRSGASSVAQVTGRITKFEVPHFSKIQELQITLVCDDPIFRSISDVELEEPQLGTSWPYYINDALSTAPHGMLMEWEALDDDLTSFGIQDASADANWFFRVSLPSADTGDILRISSDYGSKYVSLEVASVETMIASSIETGSLWPVVFPGENVFHPWEVGTDPAAWKLNRVTFKPAYWGV